MSRTSTDDNGKKDWTLGFPLEMLRTLAYPFALRHKQHVYGAFGLVKERDIAEALANGALRATGEPGRTTAVLIGKELSRDSVHEDFAQNKFRLPAGALYIKALACADWRHGAGLVREAMNDGRDPGIPRETWVEIFEEDEQAREAVMMAGLEHAFTKVMAGGEVKGVYTNATIYPEQRVGAVELLTLAVVRMPFVSVQEQLDVLDEINRYNLGQFGTAWAQHYSSYNKRKSWTSFAIRGYDEQRPDFIIAPREMSKSWRDENAEKLDVAPKWTNAAPHFPVARAVVDRIPGEKDRVRFMRLAEGGGELTRHADITDRLAGVADGKVARLHIPLVTNHAVRFTGWDARGREIDLHLPERALCYLDQRKPHRAINNGTEARVHLVVDAISSPELRAWLRDAPDTPGVPAP